MEQIKVRITSYMNNRGSQIAKGDYKFDHSRSSTPTFPGTPKSCTQWRSVRSQSPIPSRVSVSNLCPCSCMQLAMPWELLTTESLVWCFCSDLARKSLRTMFKRPRCWVFLDRFRSKISTILKATRTHARNLATFAFIYKAVMLLLRLPGSTASAQRKERSFDALVAGLIGGYAVFGRGIQSSVNQQIVIYVFARVMLASAKVAVQNKSLVSSSIGKKMTQNAWPVFASVSWGAVMWLFRWYPEALQPSLRSSMVYMWVVRVESSPLYGC